MYAGKLYDNFLYSGRLNRYSTALLPLPIPKLVVFYNGGDPKEEEITLRLSDAFKEEIRRSLLHKYSACNEKIGDGIISAETEEIFRRADPDIEVKVRMININYGHNRKILTACRPLEEYAWFIDRVRKNNTYSKTDTPGGRTTVEDAIDRAINEMPDTFEIKKFILANRAEVKDMCLTEYNETETMELLKQESKEEGRQEGLQKGLQKGRQETMLLSVRNLMDSIGCPAEKAMDLLRIPNSQRASLFTLLSKSL